MKTFRSLTFWLGLIMAVMAFVAFLFVGRIFNPPPAHVVIVIQDVPRYGVITKDVLGVDDQVLHPDIAQKYVMEGELDQYLGAVAIEPLYQGDPLTKARLISGDLARGLDRLALQLDQADQVAMVIPVKPDTCPGGVRAGDYINVEFSLGQVRQQATTSGVYGMSTPTPVAAPGGPLTVTKTITTGEYVTTTVPWAVNVDPLPLSKAVLQRLPVLAVVREREANPQYGASSGEDQPAYVEGDVIGLVVAVPHDAQEILTFAIDNGIVRVALVSPLALENGANSTLGITWEDIVAYIRAERLRALDLPLTGTLTAPTIVTGIISPTVPAIVPPTVPAPPPTMTAE
ncbi:MAG: hypothetical protein KKA73_11655 [Chloroflexi bacterium]|nr:hypothetical protein [Chloroflexota bacterium]MBU1748334.1 hypothetical protein [Chloroflexota bacterium]